MFIYFTEIHFFEFARSKYIMEVPANTCNYTYEQLRALARDLLHTQRYELIRAHMRQSSRFATVMVFEITRYALVGSVPTMWALFDADQQFAPPCNLIDTTCNSVSLAEIEECASPICAREMFAQM
jgi:hypothetical protein